MNLSKHFSLKEFTRSQTAARFGIRNEPTPEAIMRMMALCENILEPLREEVGRPVIITSGYRSPELNQRIGGSNWSQHMRGEAADIVIPGFSPLAVCKLIVELDLPFDQLIHEFGEWAHVSYSSRKRGETLTASFSETGVRYTKGLHNV